MYHKAEEDMGEKNSRGRKLEESRVGKKLEKQGWRNKDGETRVE